MLELVEAGEPKYSDTYRKRMGMAPKPSPEQKKKGIGSAPQSVGRHSMFR
jgi:hypothetical protein